MNDRPTRDCQCKRANHQHGTNAAYTRDGCRCDPCRIAGMAYQKRYRLGVLRGTANSLADATPAREHIKKLGDLYGLTPGGIAGAAGISRTVMTRLTRGQARTGRPVTRSSVSPSTRSPGRRSSGPAAPSAASRRSPASDGR